MNYVQLNNFVGCFYLPFLWKIQQSFALPVTPLIYPNSLLFVLLASASSPSLSHNILTSSKMGEGKKEEKNTKTRLKNPQSLGEILELPVLSTCRERRLFRVLCTSCACSKMFTCPVQEEHWFKSLPLMNKDDEKFNAKWLANAAKYHLMNH